jgi:hypothetical protein
MTHDGMWFYHCLQEFGIEKANNLNKAAIKSLAPIEIERIRKALGIEKKIENFQELKDFFERVSPLFIPPFINASLARESREWASLISTNAVLFTGLLAGLTVSV